uniref:Inhibitor I9 domain-containing protein n=2 Tax=Physcomitrium patens TaxID=3218 RepID=A0A7I4DX15_PHYPA
MLYTYKHVFNGFSATMTVDGAAALPVGLNIYSGTL